MKIALCLLGACWLLLLLAYIGASILEDGSRERDPPL